MNSCSIRKMVRDLKEKYGTSDPFELCDVLDILLICMHFGQEKDAIKGFNVKVYGIETILLNVDLPDDLQRLVLAHELCHALLHEPGTIHGFGLNTCSGISEREANLFAAELLIEDDDVLNTLAENPDFYSAAHILGVPPDILGFKIEMMNKDGHSHLHIPTPPRSDCLLDM